MDRAPGAELRPTPAELTKLVDLLVYAPIGLGATIVNDGPAAIKRARQEFNNARFIGQMAVTQGQAELRRRLEQAAARSAGGSPSARTDAIDVSSVRATSPGETADSSENDDIGDVENVHDVDVCDASVTAGELALPDYDSLPAIDIVDKLDHLSPGDRSAIRRYELANRGRRTVLGKLDQLDGTAAS